MCLYVSLPLSGHVYFLFIFYACSVWSGHRMLQGHVLCSSERQPVCAVVVDQLRDIGEHTATLIQGVAQALTALSLGHNYVHTTLTGPNGEREKQNIISNRISVVQTLNNNYSYGKIKYTVCVLSYLSLRMRLCIF